MTGASATCWLAVCLLLGWPAGADGCPFCVAVKPTFAQRRETADMVLVAEVTAADAGSAMLAVHQTVRGKLPAADDQPFQVTGQFAVEPGDLVVALAQGDTGDRQWQLERVDELRLAYLLRSPDLRQGAAERLAYFVRWLEHADPQIAEDAYLEFAHAPFDQVASVAQRFDPDRLSAWLENPTVRPERHGFYGLALGLTAATRQDAAARAALWRVAQQNADDFRAGYDGLLAGLLLADPEAALDWIESNLLADPQARIGDVRHAQRALRFYQEYGRQLSAERIATAMARLLDRPAVAAEALADLARWQAWDSLPQVVELWSRPGYQEAAIQRAICCYLLVCPLPQAAEQLERLRRIAPERVSQAEQLLHGRQVAQ